MGDIFAANRGHGIGAMIAGPGANRDESRRGPGWQLAWPLATLEAVVWAAPVFVVGCPRSGTTLVQTILDSHPSLSVLYEADALVDIPLGPRSCITSASKALSLAEAHASSRLHGFDTPAADSVCRELGIADAAGAMRVLAASKALAQGKRRWGTKTPKALLHLAPLACLYPDAQFVHVIRDGRDSAYSQARVFHYSAVQGALLWRTGIRIGGRAGPRLGPDRYLEVHLEGLLASPEEQIRRMCNFLGEDFDDSLLSSNTTARDRVPQENLSIHPRLGEPPRPLLPSGGGTATRLVQHAVGALIEAELLELGYGPPGSSRPRRRIAYMIMGYALFVISLRRSLPEILRHLSRCVGAPRAAKRVTHRSAHLAFPPPRLATPAPAAESGES